MDQVSRPLQVVLAAAVVLAAVWFLALRPKPESGSSGSPPATPAPKAKPAAGPQVDAQRQPGTERQPATQRQPGTQHQPGSSLPGGLGRSVTRADQARTQANQSAQAVQRAAGTAASSASAPAPITKSPPVAATKALPAGAAAKPTPAAARAALAPSAATSAAHLLQTGVLAVLSAELLRNSGLRTTATAARRAPPRRSSTARPPARRRAAGGTTPAAVNNALADGNVVVLLFWDPRGSDDRAVRNELRRVRNRGGRTLTAAVPIRQVSRYGAVTRGVQVLQSPTILIVDRARQARTLTGYTDAAEIGQAITEALRVR